MLGSLTQNFETILKWNIKIQFLELIENMCCVLCEVLL